MRKSKRITAFALSFSMILAEGAVVANASIKDMAGKSDSYINMAGVSKETKEAPSEEETNSKDSQDRFINKSADDLQEKRIAAFNDIVSVTLNRQITANNVAKGINMEVTFTLNPGLEWHITPADLASAAQAISEDGEWGVKSGAARIVDCAMAFSGGDAEMLSVLRSAVEKRFSDAERLWGQKLPSVSQDTYAEIQNRFDYWEKYGTLNGYVME